MPLLSDIRAAFAWDARTLRWRDPRGRYVSERAMKQSLATFAKAAGLEIRSLSQEMAEGRLSVGDWQEAMALRVKAVHLAMTAAASGGFHRLTAADYGRIGARLRQEYRRLERFALDVEAGKLGPGRIVARATLYASAANGVYENERRRRAAGVYAQERRLLGDAEHCDVCIEEAARGWVGVGTLRAIGDSPCLANCRCRFVFRNPENP